MPVQSRSTLPYRCHQVLHPWHPECTKAASMLAKPCFRESLKIYCVLYGITGLIKLRKVRTVKQLQHLLFGLVRDTIQSTIFLGSHGLLFMPMLCTGRWVSGTISYYNMFLQILCSTYPPILVERKQRRGVLALYMANLAAEVLFKMTVHRKMITPLHNGEVLLFAVASAIYTYLLKVSAEHKHNTLVFSVVKFLIGREECAQPPPMIEEKKPSIYPSWIRQYLDQLRNHPLLQNRNQPTCTHRYHCAVHVILGFLKRFATGVLIQLVLNFSGSPLRYLRRPTLFLRTLNRNTLSLGKFFGFYCAIYRSIICLLRNLLKKDRKEHGLIAGYFAGFSMLFFKSSTIAMYMMAKLIESIYFKWAHEGKLPIIPWFDSFLYAVSTALVFHAAVVEPQAIRPAYYRFLERLTGGHFSEVNRPMMECYGVCSSKLFPNYKLPGQE